MKLKILLVEDNPQIAGVIVDYFEFKGMTMDHACHGELGLQLASEEHYDLLILDVMLPGIDGFALCRALRQKEGVDIPILLLTGKDQTQDILQGFEVGADDYLVKPFDLDILAARVNALVRRYRREQGTKHLQYEALSLDLEQHLLQREGQVAKLNPVQFSIVKLLLQQAPHPVKKQQLVQAIWGDDEPDTDLLRSHIYQLRQLIDKPFAHAYIKTLPRVGYQLVSVHESQS